MAPNPWRARFLGLQEQTLEVEQRLQRQLQDARERAQKLESRVKELEARDAEATLASVGKAIKELCTCPLTLQVMEQPALGADFYTYERESISKWLNERTTSPFTRAPMAATGLRVNKIAEGLVEVMKKHFPEDTEPCLALKMPPVLVGGELMSAILTRDEDLALELLARPIEDSKLNSLYRHNEEKYTMLHFALIYRLPRAATALVKRRDFRRTACKGHNGVLAIHIAAALGYMDTFEAIVADVGASYVEYKVQHEVNIVLHNGEPLHLPRKATATEILRQHSE